MQPVKIYAEVSEIHWMNFPKVRNFREVRF